MSESTPLWLRILIAAIPIAAAVVAGTFALKNTVNRRIERLSNLVKIQSEYPEWINPEYSIERIMLRELHTIDRLTDPKLKWRRRFHFVAATLFILFYTLFVVPIFVGIEDIQFNKAFTFWSLGALCFAVALLFVERDFWRASSKRKYFDERYLAKFVELEARSEQQRRAANDAPEGDASSDDIPTGEAG